MHMYNLFLIISLLACSTDFLGSSPLHVVNEVPFKKVIIWGHKPYTHTHSYIHAGFFKTFKHLGYETYWFDNNDDISRIDFSGSLFITEGQVDRGVPLQNDCWYVLHNCDNPKYKPFVSQGKVLYLQVYTHDCLGRPVEKLDDLTYWQPNIKCLYQPWATDLLPHEIEENKKRITTVSKSPTAYFIGTACDGTFGNREQLAAFEYACKTNNIQYVLNRTPSMEAGMSLIQSSFMAPAIQGPWQCKQGYVPCRIFKNISYGQMGITNSKTVYELFKGKIVYNADTYQLFFDAKKRLQNMSREELYELMDIVKEKHTYITRIKYILECLAKCGA